MKIYQIVAEKTGQFCGVVDYSKCLLGGFLDKKYDAEIIPVNGYRIKDILEIKKKVEDKQSFILHVQYPTLGMGNSPLFAALPLLFFKAKTVITLHEFSLFSIVRKLYVLPWSMFANALIFTNQHEADMFCKFYPWTKKKIYIVPIGTNIIGTQFKNNKRNGICYFGQIAEGKGIEDYLDMVHLLRQKGSNIQFSIMGALIDESSPIAMRMHQNAKAYGIDLFLNKDSTTVSKLLSKHRYAVLPFPDGVTDKRGSALACLVNGTELITVHTDLTPQWWKNVSHNFISASHAADIILNKKTKEDEIILNQALEERQWGNIIAKHINIYKEL